MFKYNVDTSKTARLARRRSESDSKYDVARGQTRPESARRPRRHDRAVGIGAIEAKKKITAIHFWAR